MMESPAASKTTEASNPLTLTGRKRAGAVDMRALLIVLLVAGCTSLGATATLGVDAIRTDVCSVWLQITYDDLNDTPETVADVQANNRAQAAYCEGT